MKQLNYSDFEELSIYQIAYLWEMETGVQLLAWLHRMAKGMFPYIHLTEETTDTPMQTVTFNDGKLQYRGKLPLLYQEKEIHCLDGTKIYHDEENCKATTVLMDLATKCIDFQEPIYSWSAWQKKDGQWDGVPLEEGGTNHTESLRERLKPIIIRRDHFRAWCETTSHALPRFWFPRKHSKTATVEKMIDEIEEGARKYSEEARRKGTLDVERYQVLAEEYKLCGVKLHDVLWPEKREERKPAAKNKALSDFRKKHGLTKKRNTK